MLTIRLTQIVVVKTGKKFGSFNVSELSPSLQSNAYYVVKKMEGSALEILFLRPVACINRE